MSRFAPLATIVLSLLLSLATACAPAPAPTPTAAPAKPTAAPVQPTTAPKPAEAAPAKVTELILSTTTSTADSGLLDVLIPAFEKQSGYKVKPIAVGSGQAMTMGERGEADVLLVHAPDSEKKFMADGHGVDRKLVMHNDFIIVGPTADPAKLKGTKTAKEALQKLVDSKTTFISRGDNSGTHQLELGLWKTLNQTPKGQSWYQETGQGMGATLRVATEKGAYTITDRATYLANQKTLQLDVLVEGDAALLNIYHVIVVDPKKSDKINNAGAKAFADFMVNADTQKLISQFGVDKYGQPLFFPDAGKKDEDVGK